MVKFRSPTFIWRDQSSLKTIFLVLRGWCCLFQNTSPRFRDNLLCNISLLPHHISNQGNEPPSADKRCQNGPWAMDPVMVQGPESRVLSLVQSGVQSRATRGCGPTMSLMPVRPYSHFLFLFLRNFKRRRGGGLILFWGRARELYPLFGRVIPE